MNRRNNDILWKGMLEEVFDDLLRLIFPKADQIFDMKRGFEFLEKELGEMYPNPEKKSNTKFVDKLVKVYQKDGSEEWVLCHVEIQGNNDPAFAKRMFKYYCRIFDRYDRPMSAIAIFTGKDGKRLPGMYERRYLGSELIYKYNTLCILDYEEKSLVASANPFALVILAAKKALLRGKDLDKVLLKEKVAIANLLIKRGYSQRKTDAVLSFLHNYVRFAKTETNRIFGKALDRITGKINTMGIIEQVKQMKLDEAREKARREAERKSRRLFVENLLSDTKFSVKKIASLADVRVEFVNRVKAGLKVK